MANYHHRTMEPALDRAVKSQPAVIVTGPRQAGKTTLLRTRYADTHDFVELDLPDVAEHATEDPRDFLRQHPPPVILDEAQSVPDIWPYLRSAIDARRDVPGQYLITGSENLALSGRIGESLAGRVAMLTLLPMTLRERLGRPHAPLPWQQGSDRSAGDEQPLDWQMIVRGGYPEVVANPDIDATAWLSSYASTYLERDVAGLHDVDDLPAFRSFLRLIAASTSQQINLADIGRDVGIAHTTARRWLGILEATYQVFRVPPFLGSERSRVRKRHRIYFTDTGLACALTGISTADSAARGPLAGPLFETAVAHEVTATLAAQGLVSPWYFWRTQTGQEVDLIVETGHKTAWALESKASATPRPRMGASLRSLAEAAPDYAMDLAVIHTGERAQSLGHGVRAIPLTQL